ncbi:hypothetical protein GW17_00001663, partial [Ensete ventricosum]
LSAKVDGKSGEKAAMPTSPRSKHSAMEQRRRFLTTITQALQSSGVDLSQASISVQINLGRRANRRSVATTTMSSAKDDCNQSPLDQVMGDSVVGSNGDESEQAPKRQKIDDH